MSSSNDSRPHLRMLRITNGKVYDPANGIDGVVKDICIADGQHRRAGRGRPHHRRHGHDRLPWRRRRSHARRRWRTQLRAWTGPRESARRAQVPAYARSTAPASAALTPTTFATGYLYAGMGWTTVNEAAVPDPHGEAHPRRAARHADRGQVVLAADGQQRNRARPARSRRVRTRQARRRLVDLGREGLRHQGRESRRRRRVEVGQERKQLHEPIEGYQQTHAGARSSRSWRRSVDDLGLPHPVHLHCNNLGDPGNVVTTIETMKDAGRTTGAPGAPAVPCLRRRRLGHHAIWRRGVADAFNAHPEPDCATPVRCFSATPSRSRPTARGSTCSISSPAASGATSTSRTRPAAASFPTSTATSNLVNAIQWAVGLELLLLIKDPWRVFLTTDHPNGGCFWRYPEIIRLLMDVDFRKEQVRQLPAAAQNRILLGDLDRQYTLSEVAIVTSAGPARALGLCAEGTPRRRRRRRRDRVSGTARRRGNAVYVSALRAQGRRGHRRGR